MRYDKIIFEISNPGQIGHDLYTNTNNLSKLPNNLKRGSRVELPAVSEPTVVRHYTNLSNKNYGVDTGFYPLGSCTMKYNPKINEEMASLPHFMSSHPLAPISANQGSLKLIYETDLLLREITGMDYFSLAPFAGAHGELLGLWIIKQYHQTRKDFKRTKIIIPDSAHGTNPASAAVAGFDILEVKSNVDGTVNVEDLKTLLSPEVAGIMLTNPNTLGIFEKDILTISKLIHDCGGLLYYDGANLNALLGQGKPAHMGFDIVHLNVHKTLSAPHGGGGPGAGPVGVVKELFDYLPNPVVRKKGNKYEFFSPKKTVGRIGRFYGNFQVIAKTNAYIKTLGAENLSKVGGLAVLNANYIRKSLEKEYVVAINGICMHEVVFDGLVDKSTGIKTLDVAKRLLDYGLHPPTIYFPLIVSEAMMVEPTETESLETLNHFVDVMKKISIEAKETPEILKDAPYDTIVRRLDETTAARNPILKFDDIK
ncbi:MAG: aminomethyl-transferring glycine dehydrogenase subunit GcvPB [Acholeplasmataceae bacterium]|jgi:glycine dehydrogenase subunit 2